MKLIGFLFIVFVIVTIYLFSTHLLQLHTDGKDADGKKMYSPETLTSLMKLVRAQNHTIVTIGNILRTSYVNEVEERQGSANGNEEDKDSASMKMKDTSLQQNIEVLRLKAEVTRLQTQRDQLRAENRGLKARGGGSAIGGTDNSRALIMKHPDSSIEEMCERRFGLSLLIEWKSKAETWCGGEEGVAEADLPTTESKLICYPHMQEHRKISRQGGPDTICVANNFVIDFSKVSGSHKGASTKSKLSNYLTYGRGALQASCKKTGKYQTKNVHKHLQGHLASFEDGTSANSDLIYVSTPTYLLTRDEDCENSFHSTADFMNMFVVSNVIGISPEKQQVLLWDTHPDGPYLDLIQKAYSGAGKVERHSFYGGKKIMFKKLIFHMESPAGLIFPKIANPTQLRCKGTGLFKEYAKHVLSSFDLWNVEPPAVPHATLLLRHRTDTKNVGRILANEDEVVQVLEASNMITYNVVDTAKMPYAEQLALIRRTNILIGVHGAGLMLILFAANEAVLVEVHPSYRQDRHFRHASRMVGKDYMPLRATERETCVKTSDNVKVPIEEFRRAMDGALRLARGYDDGISECGLMCPAGILALDSTLDKWYGARTRSKKGPAINTRFPC